MKCTGSNHIREGNRCLHLLVLSAVATTWCAAAASARAADPIPQGRPPMPPRVVAQRFVKQFCLHCHTGAEAEADLALDEIAAGAWSEHEAAWLLVLERLGEQEMPPEEEPQPGEARIARLSRAIEQVMDASAAHPLAAAGVSDHGRLVRRSGAGGHGDTQPKGGRRSRRRPPTGEVAGRAAGNIKGARHIRFEKPTPLANLHLTLQWRKHVGRIEERSDENPALRGTHNTQAPDLR